MNGIWTNKWLIGWWRHAGRVAASWRISNRCRPGPSNKYWRQKSYCIQMHSKNLNMHVYECRLAKVQPRSPLLFFLFSFGRVIWQLMAAQAILTVESEPLTCWVDLIVFKSIPLNQTHVFQGMGCAASLNSQANASCRLKSVLDCFKWLFVTTCPLTIFTSCHILL